MVHGFLTPGSVSAGPGPLLTSFQVCLLHLGLQSSPHLALFLTSSICPDRPDTQWCFGWCFLHLGCLLSLTSPNKVLLVLPCPTHCHLLWKAFLDAFPEPLQSQWLHFPEGSWEWFCYSQSHPAPTHRIPPYLEHSGSVSGGQEWKGREGRARAASVCEQKVGK